MRTAYAIAFKDDRFLMVWHKGRNGWEMPGGHVEEGETSEQAAAREFLEEAGYEIEIVATRDIGYCDVCAAILGEKVKDGKNQKTVLRDYEVESIINTFINREQKDDFSVIVPFDVIKEKNYSFSAGQYFEVKIEYVDITAEEFESRMSAYKTSLAEKFKKGHELEQSIMEQLGGLGL